MTDLEQRVAAALAEARYGDKIKPGMSPFRGRWLSKAHAQVAPFLAALAAQGLAITEAPDAEPGLHRDGLRCAGPTCGNVEHHPTPWPDAQPGLDALPDDACGAMGLCERRKGHEGKHTTSVDRALEGVVLRAAPPSSVDGEGLRAAASEVIAERNREGYFAARSVEFWHAVDRLESAFGASGSASGAAEEGPE